MEVSSPSAPLGYALISVRSLPIIISPIASSSAIRVEKPINDGLCPNVDGRHSPGVPVGSSPSNADMLVARQTCAPFYGLEFASGSAALLRLEAGGCASGTSTATATTTTSTSGLRLLNHGHQRQALHGMAVNHDGNTASSSPRRPLTTTSEGDVTPLLPVRQWPGQHCIPSGLLTQLAVTGLVSMLLIMGLTALLHLQSPIFAHLPSSSLVVLSCLSTLSPKQGGALDSVKNTRRRQGYPERQPGRLAMTGLARAPLACL